MEKLSSNSDGQNSKDWTRRRLLDKQDSEPEKEKSSKERQFKEMIRTLADRIAQLMSDSSHTKQKRSSRQSHIIVEEDPNVFEPVGQ
ncbi:hypothetical protein R1flu_005055 [Riccia fluitans]|uniref:Uncharacterized protein n=1 Tax=Riccia fluitans TaxID=41844 RepID=A0ABD1YSK6_9MARC